MGSGTAAAGSRRRRGGAGTSLPAGGELGGQHQPSRANLQAQRAEIWKARQPRRASAVECWRCPRRGRAGLGAGGAAGGPARAADAGAPSCFCGVLLGSVPRLSGRTERGVLRPEPIARGVFKMQVRRSARSPELEFLGILKAACLTGTQMVQMFAKVEKPWLIH